MLLDAGTAFNFGSLGFDAELVDDLLKVALQPLDCAGPIDIN